MRTEDLIDQLSARVPRLSRQAGPRRLLAGVGGGTLAALVILLVVYGLRPDLATAGGTVPFWMKWAFTVSLAVAAFAIVRRLARPEGRIGAAWIALATPLVIVAALGVLELGASPPEAWMTLWIGRTAARCSSAIVLLSAPTLVGLLWSLQRLAPTRPVSAGAAAGVLAGAAGAAVYALTCPEQTAVFMATWYTGGIALTGVLGGLLGGRLLRW